MQVPGNNSIQEATERVKQRLPLEKIRCIEKYKDITPEGYESLMKNAETFALMVLETYCSEKENNTLDI